ncbi:MAG: hypothetical protein ACE14V_01120 [bacterium]
MSISLAETQAITELANFLYDFLPGTPFGDATISFPGAAHEVGLDEFWQGGSKLPAVRSLLECTLGNRRDRFCSLIIAIVQKAISYRSKKGNPLTQEELKNLNDIIVRLSFKIPELWDPTFIDSLPRAQNITQSKEALPDLSNLKAELIALTTIAPHIRGIAFEKFLNSLFIAFKLNPRLAFKLGTREQIDGSFELDHELYLVEAKWENSPTGQGDLVQFKEQVESKAQWSRGLFVSHAGFTENGLDAFSRGRATNLIGMSGQDLYFILDGKMSLAEALRYKVRIAGETGRFYVPVQELSLME